MEKTNKIEVLEKPPVSEAQRKAMWAAASGHSSLGIPKSVGKEFSAADTGGKLPEKKVEKDEDSDAVRAKYSEPKELSFDEKIAHIKQKFNEKNKKGVSFRQQIQHAKSKYHDFLTKSNYGPKGMNLYDPAVNLKRKANRTGEEKPFLGPNRETQHYTSAAWGTAKQQAAAEGKKAKTLSGPVKTFTPEQVAAFNTARAALPPLVGVVTPEMPKVNTGTLGRPVAKSIDPWSLQATAAQFEEAVAKMFPELPRNAEQLAKMVERNPIADFFEEAQKPVDQSKIKLEDGEL